MADLFQPNPVRCVTIHFYPPREKRGRPGRKKTGNRFLALPWQCKLALAVFFGFETFSDERRLEIDEGRGIEGIHFILKTVALQLELRLELQDLCGGKDYLAFEFLVDGIRHLLKFGGLVGVDFTQLPHFIFGN